MEEGSVEQTTVVMRLIAAAKAQGDDPGWAIKVLAAGIQITYTWRHDNTNHYMVENLTRWISIARMARNPLITAMADLLQQKMDFKP